ncbi:hypothetical protein [Paenibacillus elgii]|uniref:hypothetical protein n=1 Tax=Paenibacillus elgii TaxID=189691 RepID=UPI000248D23A|nr:hypothetical protein [Paenibacillus elgii]
MSEVKYMDTKEFREKGFLFEVNRQFFHPLGLALEIKIDDEGNEYLGGVWDHRDDPEGMLYDEKLMQSDSARQKKQNVIDLLTEKAKCRTEKYGYVIQPVKE